MLRRRALMDEDVELLAARDVQYAPATRRR
jgi:hypothetical protein